MSFQCLVSPSRSIMKRTTRKPSSLTSEIQISHRPMVRHRQGEAFIISFQLLAPFLRPRSHRMSSTSGSPQELFSNPNFLPSACHPRITADKRFHPAQHYPSDSWNEPPGTTNLYGCLKQLNLLKRRHRHLKVLLSVGGWTYSANFAAAAATAEGRRTFAGTCVRLVQDLGLDGVDIDWEYPGDEREARDFVELLREVRRGLDGIWSGGQWTDGGTERHHHSHDHHLHGGNGDGKMLLSVACPAGPHNYHKLKVPEMDAVLDFWNLMAYDYAGSWDNLAGHQANLLPDREDPARTPFDTLRAVEHYTREGGVARHKLVIGMPLYGRAFVGTDGLGKRFAGVGEGSWENGIWDFKALPRDGAVKRWDERVGASWSWDEARRTVVSYDDARAARFKAEWVRGQGLGGAMWWESSGDRKVGEGSLIEAVSSSRPPGGSSEERDLTKGQRGQRVMRCDWADTWD